MVLTQLEQLTVQWTLEAKFPYHYGSHATIKKGGISYAV